MKNDTRPPWLEEGNDIQEEATLSHPTADRVPFPVRKLKKP
jgi:hypothetical protein